MLSMHAACVGGSFLSKTANSRFVCLVCVKTIGVHKDMVSVSSDVPQKIRAKVKFRQMDPCALQPDLGCYGCVLLTNVLERIPSPMAPLARMGGPRGLVKPGGALVIACSGDWSEKFSEKKLWLEGISDASGSQVCEQLLWDYKLTISWSQVGLGVVAPLVRLIIDARLCSFRWTWYLPCVEHLEKISRLFMTAMCQS